MDTPQIAAVIFTTTFFTGMWFAVAHGFWEDGRSDIGSVRTRMLRAIFWPVVITGWVLQKATRFVRVIYNALVHNRDVE